jgi:hypothetical protein
VLRLLTIAACALAVGGGFAIPSLGFAPSAPSKTEPLAPPASTLHPIPARMLGPRSPVPIPPSVLQVRNGWLVSDGRTLVAVYAGAAGNDSSAGRLVIVRQDLHGGTQTMRTLDEGPTGALSITAAPLGNSVEVAQRGSIRLRTSRGRALRLDLGTGTVGPG